MTLTESQAASGLLTAALQSQDKETTLDSWGHAQQSSTVFLIRLFSIKMDRCLLLNSSPEG